MPPPKKEKRKSAETIRQEIAANKRKEVVLETKAVDYNNKKLLKIDSKTSIYIDIDADHEIEIQKYLSTYANNL